MATLSQLISLPTLVEMVEVLATRRATQFAKELGFEKVMVEGDSEIIIKAIHINGISNSSYGHIIQDIRVVAIGFQDALFCHVCQLGNSVTHMLARQAFEFEPFIVQMETVPPDVSVVYNFDLNKI